MKLWQVDNSCMIKGVKITPGEYEVIDWMNEGFWISYYGMKIFVTSKESMQYGKAKVKMDKVSPVEGTKNETA